MRHYQDFHEKLIPLLVFALGSESYLEFGTHLNETIGKVVCAHRYGVDVNAVDCDGATMFKMSTIDFLAKEAAAHAPYDFVFIDADHRSTEAMGDFNGVFPFVSPEGLICLHDTNPERVAHTNVEACADSWVIPAMLYGKFEAVTLPYHPGLTIVRKRLWYGPKP